MIISALDRLKTYSTDLNILNYSTRRIAAGETKSHYSELQNMESTRGIVQVGPKIAAFYLRDVVSLFQLEDRIERNALFCLQPIDVWVRRLAMRLEIVRENASDETIQVEIVKMCEEQNVQAFRFNQGAWYLGAYAFDLLLEEVGRPDSH
jgi:hypothetical protein